MNEGDWWPSEGRYGVMCISGFPSQAGSYDRSRRNSASHGFSFWVVDSGYQGYEVAVFKAQGKSLEEPLVVAARKRAIARAVKENRAELKRTWMAA